MKDFDLSGLLRKTEELRALFVLGQRVIPFLEELFSFVGDIQPLLEEINRSIKENISKMPNLSQQLSKVTEATELATTEILDIIDGILYKLDIISNNLNSLEKAKNIFQTYVEITDIAVAENLTSDEKIAEISDLVQKPLKITSFDFNNLINGTFDFVEKIRSDSTSIMLALQVQDITSQQIAAVNHLLNTVQDRLNHLINRFQTSDVGKIVNKTFGDVQNISKLHRDIAFDPDAIDSINNATTRQEEIDLIFNDPSKANPSPQTSHKQVDYEKHTSQSLEEDVKEEKFSQSEIDKLFNSQDS